MRCRMRIHKLRDCPVPLATRARPPAAHFSELLKWLRTSEMTRITLRHASESKAGGRARVASGTGQPRNLCIRMRHRMVKTVASRDSFFSYL